jgi:hypothetical protein
MCQDTYDSASPLNWDVSNKGIFVKCLQWMFLFGVIVMAPVGASAQQYTNGWTESTFKSGVNGCLASAVPKQMKFMSSSGQIKPGATPAQIEAARAMVINFVTAVCTCALRQYMRDTKFEEAQSIRQRPDYVRQVMTTCSDVALRNRR